MSRSIFDKLAQVEARYSELENQLSDPEILAKQAVFQKLAKERADKLLPRRRLHVFEGKHEDVSGSPKAAQLLQSVFDAALTEGSALVDQTSA